MGLKTFLALGLTLALLASFVRPQATVSTCNAPNANGISTFVIKADSSLGNLNFILIQFDTIRKLVVSSTILQDDLNALKNFDRLEPFRPYNCSSIPAPSPQPECTVGYYMTTSQQATSNRTTWDRGHLTPANPMRFSEDALNSTFYCVNIAPQDPYTNQNPWRIIEVKSENKLKSTTGMVMTGVCSADNSVDGPVTYRGWVIPQCFWKLVCYRDYYTKQTKVVGFIGDNTLINFQDTAKKLARDQATMTPRSQNDILKLLTNPTVVSDAWTNSFVSLTPGRKTDKLPTASECINAKTITAETVLEWQQWIAG